MNYLVVAEKGSIAKSLRSFFNDIKVRAFVTAVKGHIFEADFPKEFKDWRIYNLSEIFKLRKIITTIKDQESYKNLFKFFKGNGGILVIATDNDHEGELIGFEILSIYRSIRGTNAPFFRMRFNSTNKSELLRAWNNLEKDLNWRWVDKAAFRRDFDLITGASFTRLLTLKSREKGYKGLISWGSCQTCTLYFIVEREKEIKNFKPKRYWYIKASLEKSGIRFIAFSEHFENKDEAEKAFSKIKASKEAVVLSYDFDLRKIPRPLPSRTDDALRDLTKLTKLSASKILSLMEQLYAEGYISYPRTDTNKYRAGFDFYTPLKAALAGISRNFELKERPEPRNGDLDDNAHPPIYPTDSYHGSGVLKIIWEYIARRFVANAFMEDSLLAVQKASISINSLVLNSEGRYIYKKGFYSVFPYFSPKEEPLPNLSRGERLKVIEIELIEEKTKPPPRLSEAELLAMMEKNGIGTDATRAIFPSLLVQRGYAVKEKGVFKPTELGIALIDSLKMIDERLVTPSTRRFVEENMELIEKNKISKIIALENSLKLYHELFEKCKSSIEEISSRLVNSKK